jgi:hypothetical protein
VEPQGLKPIATPHALWAEPFEAYPSMLSPSFAGAPLTFIHDFKSHAFPLREAKLKDNFHNLVFSLTRNSF